MQIFLSLLTSVILCPDLVGDRAGGSEPHMEFIPDLHRGGKSKGKPVKKAPAAAPPLWPEASQVKCNLLNLDFGLNIFDDQYRGCSEILEEDVMPNILLLEKSLNPLFGLAWNQAEVQWKRIKSEFRLPTGFKDEFAAAIRVYTTDWPKERPIYKVFNENIGTGGKSRDHYMWRFHFKALHFYLTRALQLLKKNSRRRHQAFRGTDNSYEVSEDLLRFGRFTSSSLNLEVAKEYEAGLLFEITTCFGVDIHKMSFFPKEKEVLIPVAETFNYIGKKGDMYVMNSTCQLCSYFNCALFGEEKRAAPLCSNSVV